MFFMSNTLHTSAAWNQGSPSRRTVRTHNPLSGSSVNLNLSRGELTYCQNNDGKSVSTKVKGVSVGGGMGWRPL